MPGAGMKMPEIRLTDFGPMASGSSATLLRDLLEELERELVKWGVDPSAFSPPATREAVARKLTEWGLNPLEELIVWFGWHDGLTVPRSAPRFQFASLASLETPRLVQLGLPEEAGQLDWLYLMPPNPGLTVRCDGDPSAPPVVTSYIPEYGGPQVEDQVVSLCTPVTWWIEGLRAGAYRWHDDGRLDVDTALQPPTARGHLLA